MTSLDFSQLISSSQATETADSAAIDRLLEDRRLPEFPSEMDALLELRTALDRSDAEGVLREFYRARLVAERHFHLLFYRLRCWLPERFELEVVDRGGNLPPERLPLRLEFRRLNAMLTAARHEVFEQSPGTVRFDDLEVRVCERVVEPNALA